MWGFAGSEAEAEACFAVWVDPVSIWTTCLKEVVCVKGKGSGVSESR